ncbi:MAG: hypothetical protein ABR555_07950 [Pyrinomonadaceae bacterium]
MVRRLLLLTPSVIALLTVGCGASLFKVKPVSELPPLTANLKSADAGGVTIRVAPLLTDEQAQELFEANLPVSGVLPLRVELKFQSGLPIEMKAARFKLRAADGREWKLLSTKQAVARILKANAVFAYNPNSRKEFEKEFDLYALDVKTPLSSADPRREGFLFFQTPDNGPVEITQTLTLTIERLPQPASLQLN